LSQNFLLPTVVQMSKIVVDVVIVDEDEEDKEIMK
jgi:hypothetical protein